MFLSLPKHKMLCANVLALSVVSDRPQTVGGVSIGKLLDVVAVALLPIWYSSWATGSVVYATRLNRKFVEIATENNRIACTVDARPHLLPGHFTVAGL